MLLTSIISFTIKYKNFHKISHRSNKALILKEKKIIKGEDFYLKSLKVKLSSVNVMTRINCLLENIARLMPSLHKSSSQKH